MYTFQIGGPILGIFLEDPLDLEAGLAFYCMFCPDGL